MFQKVQQAVAGEVASEIRGPPHWQDGICSCCDDTGICCQTLFCYPCTASNMINKRETGAGVFDCATCICFLAANYVTGNEYPLWLGMGIRRAIIERYGIKHESTCSTFMLGTCCAPCVWCQIQREMGKRNEHCGGCCANAPAGPGIADKIGAMAANVLGSAIANGGRVHQPGPWQSGICDCDIADCCEGYWCQCCVIGYMSNKLDAFRGVAGSDLMINKLDPLSCCGALWFGPQGFTYQNRRELVERYNIIGETHLKSLCCVLCCPFCTAIQQRREMGYRGEWPGGLCVSVPPPRR